MAKCLLCGRPLIDRASVRRGIGPECWADLQSRHHAQAGAKAHVWAGEFGGDVVLSRVEIDGRLRPAVNIPQAVVRHSPTGFEWGYGGSGPADLAYNILLHYTDAAAAERLHQEFKFAFLGYMPAAGGTIAGTSIRGWLKAMQADLFTLQAA